MNAEYLALSLSLLDGYRLSEYTFMFHRKSETMNIVNTKSRWYAGYVICDAIRWRYARDEVSLVDTCRDAPSTGRLSNDESEHEQSYEGRVGGADVIWGRWGRVRGRITLLHSKFDEILAPAERRSAGKLTKGECAGGALSNPLPLIHPYPSACPSFLPRAKRSKPPTD